MDFQLDTTYTSTNQDFVYSGIFTMYDLLKFFGKNWEYSSKDMIQNVQKDCPDLEG